MQYFTINEFQDFYGDLAKSDFSDFKLITTDTYNEEEVSKTINSIGKEICGVIAIQLAIIGLGNKNYGKVTYKDEDINIEDFFDKNNIIYKSSLGTQLEPGTLTPRRLIRFYRFLVRDFIMKTNKPSYLFKKYCPIQDPRLFNIIYPGFEHLATPEHDMENVILLIQTYMILDSRQSMPTSICERIKRVLLARGFNLEFLSSISVSKRLE